MTLILVGLLFSQTDEPASAPTGFETVITGYRVRKKPNEHKVTSEQMKHLPGGFGDPLRSLQSLPGVAMLPLLNGQLIVRGTRAGDTAFLIDGMPVPYVFHFGSGFGPSVFPSMLIESLTFTPSLAGVRYGGMLGGVIELKTRDRFEPLVHGYASVDILAASAHIYVAPTDKLAFEASVRRSYLEPIAALIVPSAPDLLPAVIPYFTDFQGHAAARTTVGDFDLWFYGSDDGFSLVGGTGFANRTNTIERFLQKVSFQELRPRWRIKLGDRFEHELTAIVTHFGSTQDNRWQLGFRDELIMHWDTRNLLRLGLDTLSTWNATKQTGLAALAAGGSQVLSLAQHRIAFYAETELQLWRFDIKAGARLSLWRLDMSDASGLLSPFDALGPLVPIVQSQSIEPRATVGVRITDELRLSFGSGFYTAPAPMYAWVPLFIAPLLSGTRSNGLAVFEENWQSVLSLSWQPLHWLTVEVNGFANIMSKVTTIDSLRAPTVRELQRSRGGRRGYGMEVFVRTPGIKGFSGWLSYTLSRTEDVDAATGHATVSDYSQTHVVALAASYALPYQINVGLRFRLGSGWPVTPILGSVYELGTDRYFGSFGPTNSATTPIIHQLDLRIDKTFVFKTWSLTTYIDVLNVYAQKNPEFDYNAWDFSEKRYISVIPILPMIGVSAVF